MPVRRNRTTSVCISTSPQPSSSDEPFGSLALSVESLVRTIGEDHVTDQQNQLSYQGHRGLISYHQRLPGLSTRFNAYRSWHLGSPIRIQPGRLEIRLLPYSQVQNGNFFQHDTTGLLPSPMRRWLQQALMSRVNITTTSMLRSQQQTRLGGFLLHEPNAQISVIFCIIHGLNNSLSPRHISSTTRLVSLSGTTIFVTITISTDVLSQLPYP
ncbi:hypothetical protein BGX20_001949 [Mortierella sp. AD010]|nr:hypothetical protein BGX20_001949 [Mortierella sp. AD010]